MTKGRQSIALFQDGISKFLWFHELSIYMYNRMFYLCIYDIHQRLSANAQVFVHVYFNRERTNWSLPQHRQIIGKEIDLNMPFALSAQLILLDLELLLWLAIIISPRGTKIAAKPLYYFQVRSLLLSSL